MNDPFRLENMTGADKARALDMAKGISMDGVPLNTRLLERVLSSPEEFNSKPLEMREAFFANLGSQPIRVSQTAPTSGGTSGGAPSGLLDALRQTRREYETRETTKPQADSALPTDLRSALSDTRKEYETKQAQELEAQRQQEIATAAVNQASIPQLDAAGRVVRDQPKARETRKVKDFMTTVKEGLVGGAEAAATLATGTVAAPIAAGAQFLTDVTKKLSGEKPKDQQVFKDVSEAMTFAPRTETGKEIVETLGEAFVASKLPPVATPELMAAGLAARKPVVAPKVKPQMGDVEAAETQAIIRGEPYLTDIQKAAQASKTGQQASVGAAGVDVQTQRLQRAKELPFPYDHLMDKSQITRDPADVRFARETAKDPVMGQQFQKNYADTNAILQKNLDFFAEQTQSEKLGLPPADFGKSLSELVSAAKEQKKLEVSSAYKAARNAGETAELVDIKPLQQWALQNRSAAKNAPVIGLINSEIKRLSKDGKISLNDIEEIRKSINDVYDVSLTNARFGGRANKVIDEITLGKGGDLYKEARSLSGAYKKEFLETPALSKITAMKGKTTQRQVAVEDLVETVMLKGTGEDVRQLFASLNRMGPEGQAMINDLRGYVAESIKNQSTKGVQLDIYGNRYLDTKALDTIITNLDKSKKLEFLFGKKTAEQYRTLNEGVKDLQTIPRDTTNPSGTSAQLLSALAEMGAQYTVTGVPVPLLTGAKKLYDYRKQQKQMNKINEFLNYGKTIDKTRPPMRIDITGTGGLPEKD